MIFFMQEVGQPALMIYKPLTELINKWLQSSSRAEMVKCVGLWRAWGDVQYGDFLLLGAAGMIWDEPCSSLGKAGIHCLGVLPSSALQSTGSTCPNGHWEGVYGRDKGYCWEGADPVAVMELSLSGCMG